jgi:hypothetical protein
MPQRRPPKSFAQPGAPHRKGITLASRHARDNLASAKRAIGAEACAPGYIICHPMARQLRAAGLHVISKYAQGPTTRGGARTAFTERQAEPSRPRGGIRGLLNFRRIHSARHRLQVHPGSTISPDWRPPCRVAAQSPSAAICAQVAAWALTSHLVVKLQEVIRTGSET